MLAAVGRLAVISGTGLTASPRSRVATIPDKSAHVHQVVSYGDRVSARWTSAWPGALSASLASTPSRTASTRSVRSRVDAMVAELQPALSEADFRLWAEEGAGLAAHSLRSFIGVEVPCALM